MTGQTDRLADKPIIIILTHVLRVHSAFGYQKQLAIYPGKKSHFDPLKVYLLYGLQKVPLADGLLFEGS